jgi:dual specificity tyrosine-phosphorylation-regulated kinase 2/3/4
VLGLPDAETLKHSTRKKIFFDEATDQPMLTNDSRGELRVPNSKPLDQILNCGSDSFLDFISKCLEWNPEKRITPFDALMHDWIIEGLPEQVLIHHKKMLGIFVSESEENQAFGNNTGNQSESQQLTS